MFITLAERPGEDYQVAAPWSDPLVMKCLVDGDPTLELDHKSTKILPQATGPYEPRQVVLDSVWH